MIFRTPMFLALLSCASACQESSPTPTAPHMATKRYSKSGYDITPLGKDRVQELAKALTPEQRRVVLDAGTEAAFCGDLLNNKQKGIYVCVLGGLPMFRSGNKFESGTGWPSFYEPFDPDHIVERVDKSHGMVRVEILDARSGAHLGHVFDDGPPPTGKRYCLNSAALKFIPENAPLPPESRPARLETAYFAGGCFWGVEDVFSQVPGVVDAESGYMGGAGANPTYKQVCSGTTGHAETVKVVYDADAVAYRDLLRAFFANHDPTTLDRQGPDVGTQYRSAIFTTSPEQKRQAEEYVKELAARPEFKNEKIVTRIESGGGTFYRAEEYHQDYHKKHGGSCKVK